MSPSSFEHGSRLAHTWRKSFLRHIEDHSVADSLREAALAENLTSWTSLLTTVVVHSCADFGWSFAAKGHPHTLLPQSGQEYLGIDVIAFATTEEANDPTPKWPAPHAVFELENSARDDRVAYSLWKIMCVRANLRVVIAYRRTWGTATALPNRLAVDVLPGMRHTQDVLLDDVVIVMGSRSDGESFPWGYFKFWRLDHGVGRFTKLG